MTTTANGHPDSTTMSFNPINVPANAAPTEPMVSDSQVTTPQATPAVEEQGGRGRWSEDEDQMICTILKVQWSLQKDANDKLNGTTFWPLVSAKLQECGFDRSSEQCRSYWYGQLRTRKEFENTLKFRSVTERNSTPLYMVSKTTTDTASISFKLGALDTPGSSFRTDAGAKTGTRNTLGSLFNTGTEDSAENPQTRSGGNPRLRSGTITIGADGTASSSMSQSAKENGGMARWTERETRTLRELVLAKRSSMPEGQKELGVPFWTSISQQLETKQIYRSWQACARRFQRTNNQESDTKEPVTGSDDNFSRSFGSKRNNESSLYQSKRGNEEDTDVDDGSKSDWDDGDHLYMEDGERRRGSRKRVSKPVWTDEEHNILEELLKARRALEKEDLSLKVLSNNKLFALVSQQLKQYQIDRSAGACTLYWNNKGFARSGYVIDPSGERSSINASSPAGREIEDAFSRLQHQDFDDSPVIQAFREGHVGPPAAGVKRPRGPRGFWDSEDYDDEPSDLDRTKRRRSAGDVLGNKENETTTEPNTLGTSPGMVKRRAPKRDPSLPLIKPNGSMTNGSMANGSSVALNVSGSYEAGSSGMYDVEFPMKMKIRDLENEISSLETDKQKTVSEMRDDESEMVSIHSKMAILQLQKQKLQQSRREKEGQLDVYSSKIEKLASQKKHLEVALDIIGGRL